MPVQVKIVLKNEEEESSFFRDCKRIGVQAFMTSEAADGFPEYAVEGPLPAVNWVVRHYAKQEK